jgi:hypothetical protein
MRPRARGRVDASDETDAATDDYDPEEADADEIADSDETTTRRSWLAGRRSAGSVIPDDPTLKPTTMRGTEALYGYVIALELVGVSILNLTVTHGKGAPKHASTTLAIIGLAAALALVGVVRLNHRLIVPLAAIVAAFFVTLPKVPNSLSLAHLFGLILPVVYAFVVTQRQRKAATALVRARRASPGKPAPAARRADASPRRRGRGRQQGAVQSGPTPNRRYTPPKTRRPPR